MKVDPGTVRSLRRAVETATSLLALEVWRNIRIEAPVDHGRLAGSWQLEGGGLNWRVVSGVEYALAVHEGTRRHTIRPRWAQALRFVVRGQVILATRVEHPGTPPNPYIDRAVEAAQSRVQKFVEIAMRREGFA